MKTSILVATLIASSSMAVLSQGTIVFNNLGTVRAPILVTPNVQVQLQGQPNVVVANSTPVGAVNYGAGAAGASGTGFTAELWAGPDGNSLTVVPSSQTPLRSGSTAGYITQISTLAIPQIAPGSGGTLAIRAWNNDNGSINSWAAAMAGSLERGESAPWLQAATGGVGTPPSAPASISGLTAFNVFTPIPEPSMIALGALGLGALLLRRRKA